ncbi:MAG: hypothetical protein ABIG95_06575 [Candidatus Woesearchaeota archaeon]
MGLLRLEDLPGLKATLDDERERIFLTTSVSEWMLRVLVTGLKPEPYLVVPTELGKTWTVPFFAACAALRREPYDSAQERVALFPHPTEGVSAIEMVIEADGVTVGHFESVSTGRLFWMERLQDPFSDMVNLFAAAAYVSQLSSDKLGEGILCFPPGERINLAIFRAYQTLGKISYRIITNLREFLQETKTTVNEVTSTFRRRPAWDQRGYSEQICPIIRQIIHESEEYAAVLYPIQVLGYTVRKIRVSPQVCEPHREIFLRHVQTMGTSYQIGDFVRDAGVLNTGEIWDGFGLWAEEACAIAGCLGLGQLYSDIGHTFFRIMPEYVNTKGI